jgi:hypothetical protein
VLASDLQIPCNLPCTSVSCGVELSNSRMNRYIGSLQIIVMVSYCITTFWSVKNS